MSEWNELEGDVPPAPLIRAPSWVLRLLLGIVVLGILALVFIALDLSPLAGAIPLIAIFLGLRFWVAGKHFQKRGARGSDGGRAP